jgi:SSS family solute:Na+ symporter
VSLHLLDYVVLGVYALGIVVLSAIVSKKQKTAEDYFVAGRSMPAWAVAMAMMAALISSNTLVAHPATAYKEGLILLLGSCTLPLVLIFVAKVIVPFYRNVVGMSAYEYLGARFGIGGRMYASACFVADRVFDVGATVITTAIPVKVMTGWDYQPVVLTITGFTVLYTMFGGMKTVVWTSVAQGFVFIAAAFLIAGRLLFAPEAGAPGSVLVHAWEAGKLSLGNFDLSWDSLFDTTTTTQWLFILAYTANWSRRYIADQHMVQRYLIARTDRDASRAALWNGLVCVPVWATFMFIGVCLYGYYVASGETPPAIADHIVPAFIMQHMPAGIIGLLLAAILAASMSSISPDINSVATVLTADHVGHFLPKMSDPAKLFCGRLMVALAGIAAASIALLLVPDRNTKSVMENVVTISAILSGGMLGLFFLGFLTRRATRTGCYAGIVACLLFTAWGTLTGPSHRVIDLGFNFTLNPILLGVFSHVVLFSVGYITSLLFGGYRPDNIDQLTFRRKNIAGFHPGAPAPSPAHADVAK